MTLENEYFITMVNAAQIEAQEQGASLLVQAGTTHGSVEEQLQIIEDMIARNVDAICVVPSSSTGLISAIKKAEAAGIPVINLDTKIDADAVKNAGLEPVPYIGTNNYDGAHMGGEYALENLDILNTEVAILTGISGQQNAADRRNGFVDATEGKGSCITEIMDLVVRRTLATRKDFVTLKDETQKKYHEIMDPTKLTELSVLQTHLSETLRYYAPEANVSMEWAKLVDIDFPLPKAEVKLHEDGYKSSVQRTGHGLQRAFIMTMLQHLVAAKSSEPKADEELVSESEISHQVDQQLPSLVFAIEEPELYQHPSRQRHMAAILMKLAQGTIPGVAKRTQVIYSTHSPLFVGLDRFEQIRLLRKADAAIGKPRITKAIKAELADVAEEIQAAGDNQSSKYTTNTLRPRLQAVMTPWVNEGFFADVAVLVEGEDDRCCHPRRGKINETRLR